MMVIQLTPAQKLALNGFFSLVASVFVVTISAAYQFYAAGNVSISALLNFALLTFFITFGKALHDHIPPQARNAIQTAEQNAQKAQETTQTMADSIMPAVQQNKEAAQKVQEMTQAMADSIIPVAQQNHEALQKVHEAAQTLATSSTVPAPQQSQDSTQTLTTSMAPAVQQNQDGTQTLVVGTVPMVQQGQGTATASLSVPLVVIHMPPGSSFVPPTPTLDAKGQITTENLV